MVGLGSKFSLKIDGAWNNVNKIEGTILKTIRITLTSHTNSSLPGPPGRY